MNTLLKWMAITFATWCSLIGVATAGIFDGQTIHYQYYFHTPDTLYSHASNGDHLVGSGVEITNLVDGYGTLDFSGDEFIVNFDRGTSFISAEFNGFVISDLGDSINSFTSFSLLSNTGVAGNPVLNFDEDHLSVNWQGLGFHGGSLVFKTTHLSDIAITDFAATDFVATDLATSPAPEPETYALFLAGLGLMGFITRRRKNHQS
jgi:hypothetical protein